MKTLFCLSVTILFLALFNSAAFGATKTSAKSGPFGFPSTWTDGIAPVAGDSIVIQKGHGVGGATGTINNLTLDGTLSYSGLTVTGDVRVGSEGVMGTLHGGFQLVLKGSSIVNHGSINGQTRINGDTEQTISGAGRWNGGGEFSGAGQKRIDNMHVWPGLWSVLSVVNVDTAWIFNGGSLSKKGAGTIKGGPIMFEESGGLTSDESTGNLWTAPISINARVAVTSSSEVSAPITIQAKAILSVTIKQVFEARSDLTVHPSAEIIGEAVRLAGKKIVNNGDIHPVSLSFNRAGDQSISGQGLWRTSNATTIAGSGEKSLLSAISMNVGGLVVDSVLNINGHILTFNAGAFRKSQTGTVRGTGKIVFKDNGLLISDDSTGNLFTVPVEINSGTRTIGSSSGFSAPITVEEFATLAITAHQTLNARGDLTLQFGSSLVGQTLAFSGVNFVNEGTVNPVNVVFKREGNQTISGRGAWKSPNGIELNGSGVKLLKSDVTMQTGSLNINSILDTGGHTLTFINGRFNKQLPGSVIGTGVVKFLGNGSVNSFAGSGNLFTVPIEIVTGTRGPTASSGFDAPITVRSAATLNISANVTMNARRDLTIETGARVLGQVLNFHGPNLINNGTIAPIATFFKSGSHVLSGNGVFGNTAEMETGSSTVLQGTQQFQTLTLRSGSSFDISNATLKIGMNFNNSGTVTTAGSTIEYNRVNGDQTLLTNIAYHTLVINNPQQVFLNSPETVENTLRLESGIFEININRLTIGNCGQIIHAGGTLHGTPIVGPCVNGDLRR